MIQQLYTAENVMKGNSLTKWILQKIGKWKEIFVGMHNTGAEVEFDSDHYLI